MNKRHFLLRSIFVFLFCIISGVSLGGQKVYLAKDPIPQSQNNEGLSFFAYVNHLKSKYRSTNKIAEHLIEKGYLIEITTDLAKKEFGMEKWIGDIDAKKLSLIEKKMLKDSNGKISSLPIAPRIFVYNQGPNVGYGLFTIDPLNRGTIVAEYSGNVVYGLNTFQNREYFATAKDPRNNRLIAIDSKTVGGAARFTQHCPNEEELSRYTFFFGSKKDDIAVANTALLFETLEDMEWIELLLTTKDITSFAQLAYDYGSHYQWTKGPFLFDKSGSVIPENNYSFPKILVLQLLPNNLIICEEFEEKNAKLTYDSILKNGIKSKVNSRDVMLSPMVFKNQKIMCDAQCVFDKDDLLRLKKYLSKKNNRNKHRFFLPYIAGEDALRNSDSNVIDNGIVKDKDGKSDDDKNNENVKESKTGDTSGKSKTQTISSNNNNSLSGLENPHSSVPTFIPKANAFSLSSNSPIANNNPDAFLEHRKQLSEILNLLYNGSSEDCNKIKSRVKTILQELSNNHELSPEQKEELILVMRMINDMLSAKTGAHLHDYSYTLNDKYEHSYGLSDADSIENMFKIDIKTPPPPFNPLFAGEVASRY